MELLVELALKELDADPTAIVVEVGTGSGAVAVSVAAELPQSAVIATEISPEAMVFARLNAERHRAGVRFVRADLASALAREHVSCWRTCRTSRAGKSRPSNPR